MFRIPSGNSCKLFVLFIGEITLFKKKSANWLEINVNFSMNFKILSHGQRFHVLIFTYFEGDFFQRNSVFSHTMSWCFGSLMSWLPIPMNSNSSSKRACLWAMLNVTGVVPGNTCRPFPRWTIWKSVNSDNILPYCSSLLLPCLFAI